MAQWFSAAFGPGCDPGDLGSSPTSGSLQYSEQVLGTLRGINDNGSTIFSENLQHVEETHGV